MPDHCPLAPKTVISPSIRWPRENDSNADAGACISHIDLWKLGNRAFGSGRIQFRNGTTDESCGQNEKWITSVAAIVAPHMCTLVRDAASVSALARPA